MVHIAAKFRENTSMRFRVTVRKLNVTDGWTDRQTDGRTDGGHCNISRPRAYSVAGDNNHILVVLGICIHVSVRPILCWCTWIVFPCKMCICKYFCNIFFLNLWQSQYWPHLAFRTNVHKGARTSSTLHFPKDNECPAIKKSHVSSSSISVGFIHYAREAWTYNSNIHQFVIAIDLSLKPPVL